MRFLFLISAVLFVLSCEEAPLIEGDPSLILNSPVSMVLLPGTSLAVVANANVTLDQETGSLVAVDLSTLQTIPATRVDMPAFAGFMTIDSAQSRLYVPDRGNDALLIFDYSVPGTDGNPISFAPVTVPTPAELHVPNGVETDENPMAVRFVTGTSRGDLLFVSNNISGSVSVLGPGDLLPIDLDPEDGKLEGLPLLSSANFKSKDDRPGQGANRLVPSLDGRLLFVTSTLTNNLYVVDSYDQKVEAMIDLSGVTRTPGTRAMAIASDGLAYIVHRGARGVLVLDVSSIKDNGIDMDVLDAKLVAFIPAGRDPEGIALSSIEDKIFVSNQGDGTITMIDRATNTILREIDLGEVYPGDLIADSGRIYALNFTSNTISVLDETTGDPIGIIQGL